MACISAIFVVYAFFAAFIVCQLSFSVLKLASFHGAIFDFGILELKRDGFEKLMIYNRLDALMTSGPDIAPILAIGGFPGISVPAGYDKKGVPFRITFGAH